MTHTRVLTLGGVALLALTIGCTSGGSSKNNGSGGNGGGGEAGDTGSSTGGKKTGGTGGSKTGGNGGTKTGGTSAGGSGGTAAGGSGGTGTGGTAAGGSGGTATGGTGGAATGGTGGTKVAGISWDFEGDVQGWVNGVDHFNGSDAQCAHNRLGIGQPMVVTDQKVTGTSSIKFDIDFAVAKPEYAIVCEKYGDLANTPADDATPDQIAKRTPPNGFAVIVPNIPILAALSKKGILDGKIPAGTIIKGSYRFSRAQFGVQTFLVGGGVDWQAVQTNATADTWTSFELNLAKDNTISAFGWYEIGLLFGGLPADFKGSLYVDSVDIVLP